MLNYTEKYRIFCPAVMAGPWLDGARLNNLLLTVLIAAIFVAAALRARRKKVPVRRLPAMDSIDDAVHKAASSGRPVVYVPGVGQASAMATAASMSILGQVAAKCAACGAKLLVPHYDPVVQGICVGIVKKVYAERGVSEQEAEKANFFVSQEQFSYVAAVDGLISRAKPGACFYMGQFMAESLLLTEVGAASGAMQVAGTDSESQLPFFFASCDNALLGEEFYATGAYLSEDAILRGSLRAQDLVKILAIALVGVTLAVIAISFWLGRPDLAHKALELLRVS